MRLRYKVLLAALMGSLLIFTGAPAFATPPTGSGSTTILANGTLTKAINATTPVTGGNVTIRTKGALDVDVVEITLDPGATTGWHSHTGPHFEVVKQGTPTEISAKGCKTETFQAGQSDFDSSPGDVVIGVNHGTVPVTFVTTFIAPKGSVPRVDQPAPANCPV